MSKELITECKCTCANCDEVIVYLSYEAGHVVQCPKCGEHSLLPEPVKLDLLEVFGPHLPEFRNCEVCGTKLPFTTKVCPVCEAARKKKMISVGIALAVLAVISSLAVLLVLEFNKHKSVSTKPADTLPPPRILIAQPVVRQPKSTSDFHAANFVLEKVHGDTMATAAGDIQNVSENLYHHLRADADLLDRNGKKIGSVSDYFVDLGPHQTWHFLVSVTNASAMSIRFAGCKED